MAAFTPSLLFSATKIAGDCLYSFHTRFECPLHAMQPPKGSNVTLRPKVSEVIFSETLDLLLKACLPIIMRVVQEQ